MLIAVRHGSTFYNEDGKEKLRGWLSIPLNLDGMKMMHETAESLAAVEDVSKLYTSDLVRAVQSAQEVGQALSMELNPREELRDWNYGYLTGQPTNSATHKALKDFIDNPTKPVKEGEPFQTFLDRSVPFLTEIIESDKLYIAVTHNRVCTLISALCKTKGKHPDTATFEKPGPIDPAGLMIIRANWSISFMTAKDKVDKNT
jgi:broad specificity phosphatase PhoE